MSDWTKAKTLPAVIRHTLADVFNDEGQKVGQAQVPLRAKFRGRCITCEGAIWPGDAILYDPTARKAMHANTVRDCIVNYLPDDDAFMMNDASPVETLIPPKVGIGPPNRVIGYPPVKMSSIDPLDDQAVAEISGFKDWASYSDAHEDRVVEGPTLEDRSTWFHDGHGWGLESYVEELDSPDAVRENNPLTRVSEKED